jgi:hypothetical protein
MTSDWHFKLSASGYGSERELSVIEKSVPLDLSIKGSWPSESSRDRPSINQAYQAFQMNLDLSKTKTTPFGSLQLRLDSVVPGLSLFRIEEKSFFKRKQRALMSAPPSHSWAPVVELLSEEGSHLGRIGAEDEVNTLLAYEQEEKIAEATFLKSAAQNPIDPDLSEDKKASLGELQIKFSKPSSYYPFYLFGFSILLWMRGRERQQQAEPLEF